jgi:hypothetical protein
MLQTWIHRIKPEKETRLRAWLAEMNERQHELREVFDDAGVRAEQAFVVSTDAGPLLIYVSEVDDATRAARAFAASMRSIDVEHRAVMQECIEQTVDDLPLYACSR